MENKKHTPGPWGREGSSHAHIYSTGDKDRGTVLIAKPLSDEISVDEFFANANLIAAGPCMLEALEHALADLKALGGRTLLVESAIKKAKGEL